MPILQKIWKNRECLFSLLRFFDELFDVINGDQFLTLYKTSASASNLIFKVSNSIFRTGGYQGQNPIQQEYTLHSTAKGNLNKSEEYIPNRPNSRSFLQRQKVITSKSSSKNLSNVNKLDIFIHFWSRNQQKLRFFDVFFDVIIVD